MVELTDGRIMSVPLCWIPTVYHASPEERAKYELCMPWQVRQNDVQSSGFANGG